MRIIKQIIVKRKLKKMASLKISNFSKANTPKVAELIGNISLILATVAALPVVIASAGVAVPAAIVTASIYATAGGAMVKTFSKLLGVKENPGNPD